MSLKHGMTLFAESHHRSRYFHIPSAQVGYSLGPGHASAFKLAAEMLIDQHLAQSFNNDSLVFPVLTLYRHSVELILKDLIRLGLALSVYNDADLEDIIGKSNIKGQLGHGSVLGKHELMPLWCYTQKLITSRGDDDGDERTVAEELINQLHVVDEKGQTLRYDREPRSLRLDNKRFGEMPQVIDIPNLRCVANELYVYLEYWHSHIQGFWIHGDDS